MRKKQAMHLDARYVTMVENAYYYCNPPPAEKTVKKKRPPLQEYVRKLLYKDLSKVTTEKVNLFKSFIEALLKVIYYKILMVIFLIARNRNHSGISGC